MQLLLGEASDVVAAGLAAEATDSTSQSDVDKSESGGD
jgi:hypothetical protein